MYKYLLYVMAALLMAACNETTTIGNDLLDDEVLDIEFNRDISVTSSTIEGSPILTYGNLESVHLLGSVVESEFGSYDASIALDYRPFAEYDLDGAILDSAVLVMKYDTSGILGDTNVMHTLRVHELSERIDDVDSLYSDFLPVYEETPIAEKTFSPRPFSSVKVFDPAVDSTVTLGPQLRVRLNDDFAERLLKDTSAIKDSDLFNDTYKGFYITSEVDGNNIISFDLNETDNLASTFNKIVLYYKVDLDTATVSRSAVFTFRRQAFSHFDHNLSNSEAGAAVGSGDPEYVYVQGMAGPRGVIELPDLSEYKDQVINYAELLLTARERSISPLDLFPNENRFYLCKYDEEGEEVWIDDISAQANFISGLGVLGGRIQEDNVNQTDKEIVRFNVTVFVKNMIKNNSDRRVIVKPIYPQETARGTIFYGSDNTEYPIQLRLALTKL